MPADQPDREPVYVRLSPAVEDKSTYNGLPAAPEPEVDMRAPVRQPNDMDEDELRSNEPDIIDAIWDQDQRTKKQVGVVSIPRLMVPQYDRTGETWTIRRHGPHRHQVWTDDGWLWSDDPRAAHGCVHGAQVIGPYSFPVQGLLAADIAECERRATKRTNNSAGLNARKTVRDDALYNAMVIYLATPPRYRTRPGGWDDQRMWARYAVGNGPELIKEYLLVGESVQALGVVLQLSRFANDQEEVMGNSYGSDGDN